MMLEGRKKTDNLTNQKPETRKLENCTTNYAQDRVPEL